MHVIRQLLWHFVRYYLCCCHCQCRFWGKQSEKIIVVNPFCLVTLCLPISAYEYLTLRHSLFVFYSIFASSVHEDFPPTVIIYPPYLTSPSNLHRQTRIYVNLSQVAHISIQRCRPQLCPIPPI